MGFGIRKWALVSHKAVGTKIETTVEGVYDTKAEATAAAAKLGKGKTGTVVETKGFGIR